MTDTKNGTESIADESSTAASPLVEGAESKKKGLPAWVVLIVLAICGGVVYGAYSSLLQEKPAIHLSNKKISPN